MGRKGRKSLAFSGWRVWNHTHAASLFYSVHRGEVGTAISSWHKLRHCPLWLYLPPFPGRSRITEAEKGPKSTSSPHSLRWLCVLNFSVKDNYTLPAFPAAAFLHSPKLEALTLPLQVPNKEVYQEVSNVSMKKGKSTNSPKSCLCK